MQIIFDFISYCFGLLYTGVVWGAYGLLVFWAVRAFAQREHPHYLTDQNGAVYCPAIRETQEIKQRFADQERTKRIARITGITHRPPDQPPAISPVSISKELQELAKLKQDGLLTEEEFTIQKRKLLNS